MINKDNKKTRDYFKNRQFDHIHRQREVKAEADYLRKSWTQASNAIESFSRLSIVTPYEAEEFHEISDKLKKLKERIYSRLDSPV